MHSKIGVVLQRVFFGALAIAFLFSLFIADYLVAEWATKSTLEIASLLKHGSVIPLTFVVTLSCGVSEMCRLLRAKGVQPFTGCAYALTIMFVLMPWLGPAGFLGDSLVDREGLYWSLLGAAGSFLAVGFCCVWRRHPNGTIHDAGATLLVVYYLGFLGSFGLQLRCGNTAPTTHPGVWLLLLVVLITKSSDIGAYLVGSAIGRHKLIPEVSPGKTVEGAIGGLLGSGLAAVLFAYPYQLATNGAAHSSAIWFWSQMTMAFSSMFDGGIFWQISMAFGFGILISVFAQIGDLFESCFKRDAHIKDSGSVMPHYGGILDLVDSPLFTLPLAWFLMTRVWNIP